MHSTDGTCIAASIDVSNRIRETYTMNQTAYPVLPISPFPVGPRLHTPTPPEVDPDPAPPDDDPNPGPDSPPIPEREPDRAPPGQEPPAGDPPGHAPPMRAAYARQ
ncbi:hypothetical protein PPMP20_07830 [Paraburkholderia phymatum]|nr:hypothetical protein [Paraburkholderia phymatum]